MPKGRRTNNRHKRKRLPPDDGTLELVSRGTKAGTLRRTNQAQQSKIARPPLEDVLRETDTFLDKLRRRFRRGQQ